jgi:hypothetical protein
VGSAFGALAPLIGAPVSALGGALLGLVIGPVFAAVEGLLLVGSILGVARLVLILWIGQKGGPKPAAELMREFKDDPAKARRRYQFWTAAFTGVLMRPSWEPGPYQYGGGERALVYFATGTPGEWISCIIDYRDELRELREGDRFLVSGTVYHFESEGRLFLTDCSLKKIG